MASLHQELLDWATLLNEGSPAHNILMTAVRRLAYYEQALKIIAGEQQGVDNLMSNVDVARETLKLAAAVELIITKYEPPDTSD